MDECISSIAYQTYKNLEIILVDDGSPDNCPRILDDWAQKDKRIRVFHRTNSGTCASRNFGMDMAKGEYIAFVDNDDRLEPQFYEKMMTAMKSANADVVGCGVYLMDKDGKAVKGLEKQEEDNMELISIIVPIYNCENYLNECISSICQQSYSNLEIILVDDGSTDGSGVICDEWANKDGRIRVVHKQNEGCSEARNYGITLANGTYLCFVDADDFISLEMVEKLHTLIKKNGVKMSMVTYLIKRDEAIEDTKITFEDSVVKWDEMLKKMQSGNLGLYELGTVVWAKLFERSIFEQLRFPVGKKYEDIWIMHRVFYEAVDIAIANVPLYFYRIRSGSISHSAFTTDRFEEVYARMDKYRFLKEKTDDIFLLTEVASGAVLKAIEDYCYVRRDNGKEITAQLRYFINAVKGFYSEIRKDGIHLTCNGRCTFFIICPSLFYSKIKIKSLISKTLYLKH